jgi:transcriptional regulator with XRE-family HTH domain
MLHEALRVLRVLNDLKSVELADKLDISPGYLSEIENGKKEPTLDLIRRFAQVFKTTPSALLFFAEDITKESKAKNFKAIARKKAIQLLQRIENAGDQDLPNRT